MNPGERIDAERDEQLDLYDDELAAEVDDDLSFGEWVEQLPTGLGEEQPA